MTSLYLSRRAIKDNYSDWPCFGVQAAEAIFMSIMIGLLFFKLEKTQTGMRDRLGLLYIIGALYPYMVILDVVGFRK